MPKQVTEPPSNTDLKLKEIILDIDAIKTVDHPNFHVRFNKLEKLLEENHQDYRRLTEKLDVYMMWIFGLMAGSMIIPVFHHMTT